MVLSCSMVQRKIYCRQVMVFIITQLGTSGPHLLELSLIWNLLELVDWRCFFRQSTLERDVMENTVQAGTPAKVSKCDVEQDIE